MVLTTLTESFQQPFMAPVNSGLLLLLFTAQIAKKFVNSYKIVKGAAHNGIL